MIVHPGNSSINGYNINRSLRLRASASANLSWTPASAGNRQKFTQIYWLKRGQLGVLQRLATASNDALDVNWDQVFFNTSDQLEIWGYTGTSQYRLITSKLYRDQSGFYNILIAFDTTQATAANRIRVYDNGVEITAFASATYPPLNYNTYFNLNCLQTIGYSADTFDGYLADVARVGGQQLTPASFGETNALTGVWQPKAYTGTYGTNGFYLDFEDTSSVAALGTDSSGNGNTWTVNNVSLTAGVTYDSMTDVPMLTSATTANYAVLNPLNPAFIDTASASITNGNLTLTGSNGYGFSSIVPTTGKWYFEIVNNSASASVGIWLPPFTHSSNGYNNTNYRYYGVDGNVYNQADSVVQSYSTYGSGDVISVALDLDNGKVYFGKNNAWQGSSNPVTGTNAAVSGLSVGWLFGAFSGSGNVANANFGQRPFAFSPPTGFVALNTFNIAEGSITTSGSFTGNASADGPSINLNGVPTAMTINGNAVTFGNHADKTAYGFKVRSSSTSYNSTGTNTYSITTTGAKFKYANAQGNP